MLENISMQLAIALLFLLNILFLWKMIGQKSNLAKLGVFVFLLLPLLTVFFPQPRFLLDFFWWRLAGVGLIIVGWAIFVWVVRANPAVLEPEPEVLVTSGPYRYIRHPMYLALVFIFVGWWWIFAAVYSFYFDIIILAELWLLAYFEEKLILEPKFGQAYQQFRRQAGMFWVK